MDHTISSPQPGEMNVAFLSLTDFITISEIKKP